MYGRRISTVILTTRSPRGRKALDINTTIEEVANKFEGSIRTGRGRYIQTSMKTSTPRHIAQWLSSSCFGLMGWCRAEALRVSGPSCITLHKASVAFQNFLLMRIHDLNAQSKAYCKCKDRGELTRTRMNVLLGDNLSLGAILHESYLFTC
jgi:hypothetical protein